MKGMIIMADSRDRRVRKTEEQLTKGLTKLMKEKSIKDITVRELADEVDINRSTFYLHYKDIFDMVEKIENRLTADVISTMEELSRNRINKTTLLEFLTDIFETIYSNSDLCAVMLSKNGDISFQNKLKEIIYQKTFDIIKARLCRKASEYEIRVTSGFFIAGILGIIEIWLSDISAGTPDQMAETAFRLIENGIHGFNLDN